MPDDTTVRPATEEEIAEALAFGLRYDGRKRVHHADTAMARITAERAGAPPARQRLRADEAPSLRRAQQH
jgi:hypothetical protein